MFSTYLWISAINGIGDPVFQTSNILLNLWMEDADHVCQWWLKRLLWNCSYLSMFSWISRNGRQEVVVLILEQKSTAVDKVVEKLSTAQVTLQGFEHYVLIPNMIFDGEKGTKMWKFLDVRLAPVPRCLGCIFISWTFVTFLFLHTCSCWKRRIRPLSLPRLKPSLKSP